MSPLTGIAVVSLEQAVAAPLATRHLADLGARVIKVERPGGDFARRYDETVHGLSSYFVWLNRSKESITINLKSPAGIEVLRKLIARADVFVQNLAPGAARRLGLDAATLAAAHPSLIVCDISGFGLDGPWAGRKAYDLLVQAETGLLSLTGTPDEMARAGISVADIAAGMYAFSGILTALYVRATTGTAPALEVSLFDSLAEWVGQPAYYAIHGGEQPPRTGAAHPTIAPYGPYRTGDGATVIIAIQNDREWSTFCAQVLGRPELIDDERFRRNSSRVANRAALDQVIADRFREFDEAGLRSALDAAGIANASANPVRHLAEHPVLRERSRWCSVGVPGGEAQVLAPPLRMHGFSPSMGPVPDFGEHTDALLRELGYDSQTIAAFHADGVV